MFLESEQHSWHNTVVLWIYVFPHRFMLQTMIIVLLLKNFVFGTYYEWQSLESLWPHVFISAVWDWDIQLYSLQHFALSEFAQIFIHLMSTVHFVVDGKTVRDLLFYEYWYSMISLLKIFLWKLDYWWSTCILTVIN